MGNSSAVLDGKSVAPPRANSLSLSLYSEAYHPNATQSNNSSPSVLVQAKGDWEHGKWMTHADAEAYINTKDPTARYINPREEYVTLIPRDGFSVSFGRKSEEWSHLDDYWRLGLWQPLFRWNIYDPDVTALTGFFATKETRAARFTAFASPVYIPELGYQYAFKDGNITAPERLVNIPPTSISLLGSPLPVHYKLDQTKISQIVLHPSAGGMVRVGEDKGTWAKFSYTYEPVPRIMVGYEGYLVPANDDVEVTLHPRVVYQHVAALESGYNTETWSAWASVMGQHPVRDGAPGYWTLETITPALLGTAVFESHPNGAAGTRYSLGYLHTVGGVTGDRGPLATPSVSIFESRYPYRSALTTRVAMPFGKLELATHAIYEFTVTGVLLSADLIYRHDRHWSLDLGTDMVVSSNPQSPDGGADLMYLYRSDDRVRGKVSYLF
jgi:hypothetical protein